MPKGILEFKIKKEWFDMIAKGEKKEEYREIKPFYTSRFRNKGVALIFDNGELGMEVFCSNTFEVIFVNGYGTFDPKIKCTCKLRIGQGKEEWGAEPNKEYYILEILEVSK